MRLRLIAALLLAPALALASPMDEPGAKWTTKCVVVFSDAFKYDPAEVPQQAKDASLWKRVIVAVCWGKGQEYYAVRTGEHLFREYYNDKKQLVREGVGGWTFPPRVYLEKAEDHDVKPWDGGTKAMIDQTPFDDPYKED